MSCLAPIYIFLYNSGADPGFQVRGGAHFKKLRRAEGGANIFGVVRVKNHDFTPKNHFFSNFRGGGGGGGAPDAPPPWIRPCNYNLIIYNDCGHFNATLWAF